MVEQLIRNQQVFGSSPNAGSNESILSQAIILGDVAQLGERHVRNVEAEGSNPFISTSLLGTTQGETQSKRGTLLSFF